MSKSNININLDDLNLINLNDPIQGDLFDNMNGGQPALTISAGSVDTISLGAVGSSSGIGSQYDFLYEYSKNSLSNINNGYTITTSNNTGGYTIPAITGTNGIMWNDFSNVGPGTLNVKGDAEFDGDVKIKGKSLNKTLEKIEEKLAILHPNEELEAKWDELRELRNRYIELEKEIKEKEKMWDVLKK